MGKYFFVTLVILVATLYPQSLSPPADNQNNPTAGIEAFVGDWVGTGWGWEIRFKQTAGEFGKQFTKGKFNLPFENEKVVMSLMVTHTTHFYLNIDKSGNVKGKGIITYDLIPNLCGLAALTKQVNERINMMSLIPSIFKWASELGRNAVQNFNRVWHEEENKLASSLNELDVLTKRYMESLSKGKTPKQFEDEFMKWLSGNASSDDINKLAAGIIFNNCASGNSKFANGIICRNIMGEAMETELKSWAEMAKDELIDNIMSELSEKYKEAMQSIAKESEKGEELCRCGAGASVNAGAKYGPSTLEELVLELGPEIATSALFESALGTAPVGLVLSIPGVTQVQYYYKGLKNGPENRTFNISGKLVAGAGNNLFIELDGDVKDGDKNLTIEYMVNYIKENAQFPCWTPFLDDGADIFSEGYETVYEVKEIIEKKIFKDEKTGQMITIDVPTKETKSKKIYRSSPFATFHESGVHRNKKSMWHEYEYFWNAHKLTEPKDEDSEEPDDQKKSQKRELEDKKREIEQTGKTSFDIEFENGKESVTENSEPQIETITKVIEKFAQNKFTIVVLADSLSDKKLAAQRADFIINKLIMNGISGTRLTGLGSGKKTTGDLKKKKFKHTKVDLIKK